ncbi:MAG: hypothetical protein WC309_02595 [Candidatus Paceibacterota bacterium]|jgi:hypothetical protein
MRKSNALEKLGASIINTGAVLILSVPFYFLFHGFNLYWKLSFIGSFFFYNLFFLIFFDNRCLGMRLLKTRWEREYPIINQLAFIFLYTLSFSSLLFWVYFPFDIFLFNMLLLQLPCVLFTGTTVHGLLSGRMTGVKED